MMNRYRLFNCDLSRSKCESSKERTSKTMGGAREKAVDLLTQGP